MVHRLICFFALVRGIIIFYISHFFMLCLLRPIFVRSLLRHFHSNQVSDTPLARDSLGVCSSLWDIDCRWFNHRLIRRLDGLSLSSSVLCMKLLLDLRHFFGTMWPCSGCLISFLSLRAETLLLIAGGAIPTSRY